MYLSQTGHNVLKDMRDGWVLTKGKVMLGRPGVCWLKLVREGRATEVQKVSNATLRSLEKNGYVKQASEELTTITFELTADGIKETEQPF